MVSRFLNGGKRRFRWAGAAVCAASFVAAPAMAQQPPAAQSRIVQTAGRPAPIDRNGVLILIRSSLLAVDQANKTGNYAVLRELGSPGFQSANTTARLGDIFASLRNQSFDLSGVSVLEPQLTLAPTIEASGMMRMMGYFPSAPLQVSFDLLFEPVAGRWRIFGVAINVSPGAPGAPVQLQPQPQPQSKVQSR